MNMKDGCVLGNAGHFDKEISKKDLNELAASKTQVRDFVDCYTLKDGKRIYALETDGLGHSNVMDDANIPNLLAIPYYEYPFADESAFGEFRLR